MANANQWAFDLESHLFSKIYSNIFPKFQNANITKDEQSTSSPVFPTILIQSVDPVEENSDLESTQINTILFCAQVTVTTNKGRSEALSIAHALTQEYKNMSFKIITMPICRKQDQIWSVTFRARRAFDWNDRL